MATTNWSLIINACVVALGAVFSIISFATRGWSAVDTAIGDYRFGLYTYCVEAGGVETCDDIQDVSGELKATRSLVITGMVQIVIATALVWFHMYRLRKYPSCCKPSHLYGAIVNASLAAIMFTAAKITYAHTYDDVFEDAEFKHSFYLLLSASVNGLAGTLGALYAHYKCNKKNKSQGTVIATTTTSQQPGYAMPTKPNGTTTGYPAPPPPYGQPTTAGYPAGSYPAGQPDPYGYNNSGYAPPNPYAQNAYPQNPAYPPPPPPAAMYQKP